MSGGPIFDGPIPDGPTSDGPPVRVLACGQTEPLLPGFAGRELPGEDLRAVRQHLRGCPACRAIAADYLQAGKALRGAAQERAELRRPAMADDVFRGMHEAIMQRVAVVTELRGAEAEQAVRSSTGDRWLLAAAAVLLLSFGFWLSDSEQPSSIFDREPTQASRGGMVWALPYSGEPAEIRPAGHDEVVTPDRGVGTGMMGRGALRPEIELMPAVHTEPEPESAPEERDGQGRDGQGRDVQGGDGDRDR